MWGLLSRRGSMHVQVHSSINRRKSMIILEVLRWSENLSTVVLFCPDSPQVKDSQGFANGGAKMSALYGAALYM